MLLVALPLRDAKDAARCGRDLDDVDDDDMMCCRAVASACLLPEQSSVSFWKIYVLRTDTKLTVHLKPRYQHPGHDDDEANFM